MKKLEVMVINPPNQIFNPHTKQYETSDGELLMPPIDTITNAATIRAQGHHVTFYDMDARNEGADDLERKIDEIRPDAAYMLFDEVVQLHSHTAVVHALEMLKRARENGVTTIMAGISPSYFHEEFLTKGAADIVVRGPSSPILETMFRDGELKGVPGTSFLENGRIKELPWSYKGFDIDQHWVMPAFDLVEQNYYPIDVRALATSRGCRPAGTGCKFCPYSNFWKSYRAFSAQHAVDEMEELTKYGHNRIMFIEHNFTLDKERVLAFARELKARDLNVDFGVLSRVDVDHETIDALVDVGLKWIHFGAESGDQATLDKLRKAITVEQARETITYAKSRGLRVRSSWIIDGGDTTESIDKTVEMIGELRTQEIKPHFLSYRAYSEFGENGVARFDGQSIFCTTSENDRPDRLRAYAQQQFNALCNTLEADGYLITREEKARPGFWMEAARSGKPYVALGAGRYGVGWRGPQPEFGKDRAL